MIFFVQNNSLSARGLGGAHALATAKAHHKGVRQLSIRELTTLFGFFVRKFLKGCGGTFLKKFPHVYYFSITDFFAKILAYFSAGNLKRR